MSSIPIVRAICIIGLVFTPNQLLAQVGACSREFLQSNDAQNKWKTALIELEANPSCSSLKNMNSATKRVLETTKLIQACQAVYGYASMEDPTYTEFIRRTESNYRSQILTLRKSRCNN